MIMIIMIMNDDSDDNDESVDSDDSNDNNYSDDSDNNDDNDHDNDGDNDIKFLFLTPLLPLTPFLQTSHSSQLLNFPLFLYNFSFFQFILPLPYLYSYLSPLLSPLPVLNVRVMVPVSPQYRIILPIHSTRSTKPKTYLTEYLFFIKLHLNQGGKSDLLRFITFYYGSLQFITV